VYLSQIPRCRFGGIALALVAAASAGCGSNGGEASSAGRSFAGEARIEKCVDRLMSRATVADEHVQEARRYAEDTYCRRFERNGWIYQDGALSIAAQEWLDTSGTRTCATAKVGELARRVPCEQLPGRGEEAIECALLHHVRRTEIRAYLSEQRRRDRVRCDDGTPLDELGVP
jgi:hypothetical protein